MMETDLIFGGLGSIGFSQVGGEKRASRDTYYNGLSFSSSSVTDVSSGVYRITRTRTRLSNLQDILAGYYVTG